MFRLHLLGGVDLRDAAGARVTDLIQQPKRLALLAYLTASRNPVRRDKLLALFWPESDARRARGALNQSVHKLRAALGHDAIITKGAEDLSVDRAIVWCDVAQLASAPVSEIVRLYRGPFMDGFHVNDLMELDEWVSGERRRIQDTVEKAVWYEIDRAATAGEAKRALELVNFIERHAALLDEVTLRRAMKMQDSLGDRTAALRLYDSAEKKLRAEYDADPAPETQNLRTAIHEREEAVMEDSLLPRLRARIRSPSRKTMSVIVASVCIVAFGVYAASRSKQVTSWREYRHGELDYKAGRYAIAQADFQRAVDADSEFAMGYLGLSMAANWTGESALADRAANHAVQLKTRTNADGRLRIEAWSAYLRGAADVATPMYEMMLRSNPGDADAAFHLADLEFHWGPMLGTPSEASLAAWKRTLQLDPHNAGAWLHLARVSAAMRDRAQFESAASQVARLDPGEPELIELHALRAYIFGTHEERIAAAAEVGTLPVEVAEAMVHTISYASPSYVDIADVLLPALWARNTFNSRPAGQMLFKASVQLARGETADARATIDSTFQIQAWRAFEYLAYVTALPLGFASATQKTSMLHKLATMRPYPDERSFAPVNRAFFAGLIATSLNDYARTQDEAARLDEFNTSDPRDSAYAHYYAKLLRADVLRAHGEYGRALESLGAPKMQPDYRLPFVFSYGKAFERWLRAELLRNLSRKAEALRWYRTFPEPGGSDLPFVPAARQETHR